jgi:hypothetical protein
MDQLVEHPPQAPAPQGATINTTYVEREMKAFAVFEAEMQALASLNTQATIFFSVASGLLSFAVGIWTNAAFYERLSAAGLIATGYLAPLLLLLAAVFYALAIYASVKRTKTLRTIREQSRSQTI